MFLLRAYSGQHNGDQPPPCIFPFPPCHGPERSDPVTSVHLVLEPSPSDQHTDNRHGLLLRIVQHNWRHKRATASASTVLSTGTSISEPQTHDLTTVKIAGIALGGALGVLLLFGVVLWLLRRGTSGSRFGL
ncbi:hypothetical protein OH76DRAFT_195627 [Lentinus brumalis]|uniref:Uncharacterized protein n=1 Tax=Lentinus brumalis TaxID=2498619 RepID=A0A371DI14_9APHY|nr:hypothetical protein OH76DRAFT_195627 [Polyporus brumalis]